MKRLISALTLLLGGSSCSTDEVPADSSLETYLGASSETDRTSDRSLTYSTLSGNPNNYHWGRITDQEVERKVGLSEQEIKELTHFNYGEARKVIEYLDAIPDLDKDQLAQLLKDDVTPGFVRYAVGIERTNFNIEPPTFENVMALKSQFEAARMTTFEVDFYTWVDNPPTPEEIIEVDRKIDGRASHFRVLWDKGYSIDDMVKLSQKYIYASDPITSRKGVFNYFEEVGVSDVDRILKLAHKYGSEVAETLYNAGLSIEQLPLLERASAEGLRSFTQMGLSGNPTGMTFLLDHGVDGNLALAYFNRGITDQREMTALRKNDIDGSTISAMTELGFLSPLQEKYKVGEILTAHDSYLRHRGEL
ncbi:MAG: hypothetical protein Q7K45_06475 [Nanoarchaeota archaeon]|nr:hypothetical protein [Nanoarchaeota archaeon]